MEKLSAKSLEDDNTQNGLGVLLCVVYVSSTLKYIFFTKVIQLEKKVALSSQEATSWVNE